MTRPNPFTDKALAKSREKALAKGLVKQNESKPNPFLKKPKGKETVKSQGPPKRTEKEWQEIKDAAQKMLVDSGVRVGMVVKITWDHDIAYGPGTSSHTGTVREIGDFLESKSDREGLLRLPISRIKTIEPVTKKPNPFKK